MSEQQPPHQPPPLHQAPYQHPQPPAPSQQYLPQQAPAQKGRVVRYGLFIGAAVVLLMVGFVAGVLVGGAGESTARAGSTPTSRQPDTGPTPDPITTPTNQNTLTATTPTYPTPVAKDFKLTVKVLSKQCFGSAGCNITYRILVAYSGAALDPSVTYEVVYEVRGGEDGPVTNNLTITGDTSSVDEEEMVSTKSGSARLTAVVTDVLGQ